MASPAEPKPSQTTKPCRATFSSFWLDHSTVWRLLLTTRIPQQPRLKDRASRMRQPTAGRVQCRLSDAGTALCVRAWQPGALPWYAPEPHHIGGHVQRKSGCARGHHYLQWSRTSLAICRAFLLGLRVSSLRAATTESENTVPAAPPTLSGANTAFSSPYASAPLTPVSRPRHPAATDHCHLPGGWYHLPGQDGVAAGYREAEPLLASGRGGHNGMDMHRNMRGLLLAKQILAGERKPGELTKMPLPFVP